jgi:hypothetical protein
MRTPNADATSKKLLSASTTEVLNDLFVAPRAAVRKWAETTNQTTQAKTAYLGQHLASVLTGVPGEGTAARGNDLVDGSEVKTCSRADQLGKCQDCDAPVPAWRVECGSCGSGEVERKTDSHWLFALRSEPELRQLMEDPRVVFILFDRTHGNSNIRVRAWEVWPAHESHRHFGEFARDYYENNFLLKGPRAAPANVHPLAFDFMMMNPARIFDARLIDVDGPSASIAIDEHFDPLETRDGAPVEAMPASLCKPGEIRELADAFPELLKPSLVDGHTVDDVRAAAGKTGASFRTAVDSVLTEIPPAARLRIPMRLKRIKTSESTYRRRGTSA